MGEVVDKKELRKEFIAKRNALSIENQYKKSEAISKRLIALKEFRDANKILMYTNIRSEVITTDIYEEALLLRKDIYYPRVQGDTMEFYQVNDTTEFDVSRFGIREPLPESTKRYEPEEKGVIFVLMPGAVFDRRGNRIGYGGGYYDKYLEWLCQQVKKENVIKVAVAFACQVVEDGILMKEEHDVCVDYVVTEKEVIKTKLL